MVHRVSNSLKSARTKVERANLHTGTLKREAVRFLKAQDEPTFRGQFEENYTWYRIYVDRGLPPPPNSFALRVGDAIHNYRGALDHLAWQLTKCGAGLSTRDAERVQFPIYDDEGRFDNGVKSGLPGVAPKAIQFIKSRQRYTGGKAADTPLLRLAQLSNNDKHRQLQTVIVGADAAVITYETVDCVVTAHAGSARSSVIETGAPIAALGIQVRGPNPKVDVKVDLTSRIGLENRRDLLTVLDEIKVEVIAILNAREILAALK